MDRMSVRRSLILYVGYASIEVTSDGRPRRRRPCKEITTMRLLASEKIKPVPTEITALGRSFDPFHPDFVLDPYPALAEMQRIEPVFYAPMIDSWIVTRYATVKIGREHV